MKGKNGDGTGLEVIGLGMNKGKFSIIPSAGESGYSFSCHNEFTTMRSNKVLKNVTGPKIRLFLLY